MYVNDPQYLHVVYSLVFLILLVSAIVRFANKQLWHWELFPFKKEALVGL